MAVKTAMATAKENFDGVSSDDGSGDDGGGDDDLIGYDDADDYVSHAFYRDRIAEGFSNRAPSRLAPIKPAYFPIDDPVLRTLVASKYSAKAAEYSITVANAFFYVSHKSSG